MWRSWAIAFVAALQIGSARGDGVMQGAAAWPEEVGPADPQQVHGLIEALDRQAQSSESEAAGEARYRRALLRLEPGPGYDAQSARDDLLAVARGADREWASRAMHTRGWIFEREGKLERAREAYVRVLVDFPQTAAAARATAGLGRVELASGEPSLAATLLERALAAGADASVAEGSREAALRAVIQPSIAAPSPPTSFPIVHGDVIAIVAGAAGLHVATRSEKEVVLFGPTGQALDRWSWEGPVDGLAGDGWGRVYAAVGGVLWRLVPGGRAIELATLEGFEPPGALAVGGGAIWVTDRRGQRLGRIDFGQKTPTLIAEDAELRIDALAWDGRRLLGGDVRAKTIRQLWSADGARGSVILTLPEGLRPESLSADASARLLVADLRAGALRVIDSRGATVTELRSSLLGIERLAAATLAPDGSLQLIDAREPRWVSWP